MVRKKLLTILFASGILSFGCSENQKRIKEDKWLYNQCIELAGGDLKLFNEMGYNLSFNEGELIVPYYLDEGYKFEIVRGVGSGLSFGCRKKEETIHISREKMRKFYMENR